MKGVLVGRSLGKVCVTFMSPDDDTFTREFTPEDAETFAHQVLIEVVKLRQAEHG